MQHVSHNLYEAKRNEADYSTKNPNLKTKNASFTTRKN